MPKQIQPLLTKKVIILKEICPIRMCDRELAREKMQSEVDTGNVMIIPITFELCGVLSIPSTEGCEVVIKTEYALNPL